MKKPAIDTHSTGFAVSILFVILVLTLVFFSIRIANQGLYENGMGKYKAGDYTGAIADFRADVTHQPNHSLGHYYLACSLLNIGQRLEAHAEFNKAYQSEIHSSDPDAAFAAKCLSKSKGLSSD